VLAVSITIQRNGHPIKCHSYFGISHNLRAGITDDFKLRNTAMEWPLVALCSYQVS
jgi:hypothetical protein